MLAEFIADLPMGLTITSDSVDIKLWFTDTVELVGRHNRYRRTAHHHGERAPSCHDNGITQRDQYLESLAPVIAPSTEAPR